MTPVTPSSVCDMPIDWSAERGTDQAVTKPFCEWLDKMRHNNGVGANEAWNAGVAYARAALAERTQQEDRPGYALAMRVLQSDLYSKLDDRERAECDVFLACPTSAANSTEAISPIQPAYYVQHLGGSYSLADPQPLLSNRKAPVQPNDEAASNEARLHRAARTIAVQAGEEPQKFIDWLCDGGLVQMALSHFGPAKVETSEPEKGKGPQPFGCSPLGNQLASEKIGGVGTGGSVPEANSTAPMQPSDLDDRLQRSFVELGLLRPIHGSSDPTNISKTLSRARGAIYAAQQALAAPTQAAGGEADDLRKRLQALRAGPANLTVAEEQTIIDCFHALAAAPASQAAGGEAMPVELFDGPGVYRMLKPDAQRRTSAENVSDVLDAVVRLMNRTNDAAPAAAVDPDDFECCGNPVVGAQYMGQSEMVCCGNPEPKGAPAAAGEEDFECERCGLPQSQHTATHWCDNQSFAGPNGDVILGVHGGRANAAAPAAAVGPIFYNSEHRTAMNRAAAVTAASKAAEDIQPVCRHGVYPVIACEVCKRAAAAPEGLTDMRAICEALGFDPTNHHNAAKCPYCRPATPDAAEAMYQIRVEGSNTAWHDAGEGAYHVTTEKNRRIVYSHPAKTAEARKPMTPEQIENLRGEANRGFNIERGDYFKAFRDAESAHGIGDQP